MTTVAAPYTREHFDRLEEERLAVYASKSARAVRPRGAASPSPGDARTDYARDRDRIIHSRAFRRLKHKTQVFIPYEGDHFRTRLTHTIEVAQIARSVARALGLNEDWDFLLNVLRDSALAYVPIHGPVIHQSPSEQADRRGVQNEGLILDVMPRIYRKWPAPTDALRASRQALFATSGMMLPLDDL